MQGDEEKPTPTEDYFRYRRLAAFNKVADRPTVDPPPPPLGLSDEAAAIIANRQR